MKKLNKSELISLRKALVDVQQFIRKVKKKSPPYYCLKFDNMINNIEIYLYSGDSDLCLISKILFRDWVNANHELIGIPASEWFCGRTTEQAEDAYHFAELIATIETYFLEMEEEDEIY